MPKKNKKKKTQKSQPEDYKRIDKFMRRCIKANDDNHDDIDSWLTHINKDFFERLVTGDPLICYAVLRNHICM